LTGLPHDEHFAAEAEVADLGHLVHELVEEGKRVAAAAGVELHDDPWEMNVLATRRGSAHYPSMLEDVESRRRTEVELINGALVQQVERVIRGTTFPAGKIVAPGHVQWDVKGDTTFGPFEARPAPAGEVARLADACTRGGMPAKAVEDARGPQWRKVIFNAST